MWTTGGMFHPLWNMTLECHWSFPLHCIIPVLICMIVHVNARMPNKMIVELVMFYYLHIKSLMFSLLNDLNSITDADSAKNIVTVIVCIY